MHWFQIFMSIEKSTVSRYIGWITNMAIVVTKWWICSPPPPPLPPPPWRPQSKVRRRPKKARKWRPTNGDSVVRVGHQGAPQTANNLTFLNIFLLTFSECSCRQSRASSYKDKWLSLYYYYSVCLYVTCDAQGVWKCYYTLHKDTPDAARPGHTKAAVGDPKLQWNLVVGDHEIKWNLVVGDTKSERHLVVGTPKRSDISIKKK